MFMSKRNKYILDKIFRYLDVSGEALAHCAKGLEHLFAHGRDSHFSILTDETHQKESTADNILREIELTMYEQALLPESREDLLLLLERVDLLPNQAEEVLRRIRMEQIELPETIHADMRELMQLGIETYALVVRGIHDAFGRAEQVPQITAAIDENESVGDKLEQRLITHLFQQEQLSLAARLQVRDIIESIGALCDLAEEVAAFLTIFTVKRRV